MTLRQNHTLLALVSVLICRAAAATLVDSTSMTLSKSERASVVQQVCGEKRNEARIDALRIETIPVTHWARVTCAPYGDIAGHPALKTAQCEKRAGKWICEPASLALSIKIRDEEHVVEYSGDVTPEAAVEIVTYASGVSTFNGLDAAGLVSGRCRVSDGRSAPFSGALNFNIACEGPSASITKDCWNGGCRLFLTNVDHAEP